MPTRPGPIKDRKHPGLPGRLIHLSDGEDGRVSLLLVIAVIFVAILAYRFYTRKPPIAPPKYEEPLYSGKEDVEAGPLAVSPAESGPTSDPNASAAYEAYKAGEFTRAVSLYRAAYKDNPSEESGASLAKALNGAATDEYGSGNYERAKEMLTEALELSKEPVFLRNLANVKLKLKDTEGAVESLEGLKDQSEIRGRLKNLYVRLAEERLDKGERDGAIESLEKGLEIDPNDRSLKERLSKLKAENDFEGRMGSRDGSRFLVRYEGGENAVAGHLIGLLLEEAYLKVGSDLAFYPEDRIEALLYTKETFRDVTRSPAWAGAIYDGRIKIPAGGLADKTSELEKVVFHEYTHAVVHRISKGRAPMWLNEGIAQYEEGKSSVANAEEISEAVSSGMRLKLLEGSFMGYNSSTAHTAYLLSLSSTEYIIREFGVSAVKRVLENLGSGMSLDESLKASVYMSYDELDKAWRKHAAR
ncbi:MAG: tetratricopeptide repeat protein [Deltaproteobacteria bacterium]|nr:tetratricopeptide repeat protein [Deltaproteobacteria bacterium]